MNRLWPDLCLSCSIGSIHFQQIYITMHFVLVVAVMCFCAVVCMFHGWCVDVSSNGRKWLAEFSADTNY